MEINQSIEVTQKQYIILITKCKGLLFHRKENDKYFIKITKQKFINYIKNIIITN